MTEREKLHRAVVDGLKEVGIPARYVKDIMEPASQPNKPATTHKIEVSRIIVNLSEEMEVVLRRDGSTVVRRAPMQSSSSNGPNLADPEFFEKLRDVVINYRDTGYRT
jgi:hypothetical protein